MISSPKLRSPSKSQMAKRREMHKAVAAQALSSRVNEWAEAALEAEVPVSEVMEIKLGLLTGKTTVQKAHEALPALTAYHKGLKRVRAERKAQYEATKLKAQDIPKATKPGQGFTWHVKLSGDPFGGL